MRSIVVVGTGVAGLTTAATLRQKGYDGRLVLVGEEPLPPYRRTALSKDVLAGADLPLLKPAAWYDDMQVELLTATTVTALRPGAVELDGTTLPADAVVLATGGRARQLPGVPEALTVRIAADVAQLHQRLRPGTRLTVVGAGFLGLEVAGAAVALGAQVTVVEAAPLPLSRVLPPLVGEALASRYRAAGVDLRLGSTDLPDADVVVTAVGQLPETTLAEQAGAAVRDGIVVDRCGQTSLPGVWAVGDVAAFPHRVTGLPARQEHWQAAMTQGSAVGAALLGDETGWAELPWAWSSHLGLDLQVCGEPRSADDWVVHGVVDGPFALVTSSAGRLTGAVTVDATPRMRALRRLIADEPLTPLAQTGEPSPAMAR
jgi:3-phenylpropionate/trans-cinnamate dioxygenase ferredoxin reductase subunit